MLRQRKMLLGLLPIAILGCNLDPMVEASTSPLFECVRDGQNFCAVCAPIATDTAQELSQGCATAVTPAQDANPVTERTSILHLALSGIARIPVFPDRDVPETPVDYRARFYSEGNRIGVQLLREIRGDQEYEIIGGTPTLSPVAPNGNGDYVGDMVIPIDFGQLGNAEFAAQNNTRDAEVHIRFSLQGGNTLAAASGAVGQVETFHVEDVRIAQGGGRVGIVIDLTGPANTTFDALPANQPVDPVGTRPWRDCMQQIITRDCCVGPAIFADVVRVAQLPAGLQPPAACAHAEEPAHPEEPADDDEPEDPAQDPAQAGSGHTAQQPTALGAPPATRDASLAAGAEDWYSVQIGSAGRYSFETTTGDRTDNSATDTKLEVFASSGNGAGASIDADDDDSDDGAGSWLELPLQPGVYLIQVVGYNARIAGPYTIGVGTIRNGAVDPPADEDEEVDPPADEDEEVDPPADEDEEVDPPADEDEPVIDEREIDEEEPAQGPPDERVPVSSPYAVQGTRLHCASDSADDAACWNNVNRQIVAGVSMRGKKLRSISWEMDASARLVESLNVEVYLIYGVRPRAGRVLEETRRSVDVMDALRTGACIERGQTITCTIEYRESLEFPLTGNPGDDWFILEFIGHDWGHETAPDGSWNCGRYPHRVAANTYRDATVYLGGYTQLHDWADASCGFSYSVVANHVDLDLAARIDVE